MAQIHAEHGVAGLAQRHVRREIRLRAAVGLNVGVFCAEEPLRAVDADVFDLVDELAAAVVALAGIAFGVLVGEHGTHRRHDRRRHEVFRCDQLQISALARKLLADQTGDLGVELLKILDALSNHELHPPVSSLKWNKRSDRAIGHSGGGRFASRKVNRSVLLPERFARKRALPLRPPSARMDVSRVPSAHSPYPRPGTPESVLLRRDMRPLSCGHQTAFFNFRLL